MVGNLESYKKIRKTSGGIMPLNVYPKFDHKPSYRLGDTATHGQTDGRTDGWTDGKVFPVYPPTLRSGYNYLSDHPKVHQTTPRSPRSKVCCQRKMHIEYGSNITNGSIENLQKYLMTPRCTNWPKNHQGLKVNFLRKRHSKYESSITHTSWKIHKVLVCNGPRCTDWPQSHNGQKFNV